jgi:predicted transcriptional regulator
LIRTGTWAQLSLAAKAAYPVVKSYVNKEGVAFPSNATIGEKAGLSKASVTKALKDLVSAGLLTATSRSNKSTLYKIVEHFEIQHPNDNVPFIQTTPYLPDQMRDIVKELQTFIETGTHGKIVQINFNLNTGSGTQNVKNNIDGGEAIRKILEMLESKAPVDNF